MIISSVKDNVIQEKNSLLQTMKLNAVIWTVINYFVLSFLKIIIVLKLGGNDRYAIYARNIVTRFCYCLRFDTSFFLQHFYSVLCVTLRSEHNAPFSYRILVEVCRRIIYFY